LGSLFLRRPGYEEGLFIVPMLLMGYLLLGIYFNLSIWFKITDKTGYSFWITLAGAIVSAVVVFCFIPIWGFLGGGLSTLISYLVMCVICFFFGQKYYPIPYQTGKYSSYLIIGFALSYGGFYLDLGEPILNFFAKNSLIVIFIGLLVILEKGTIRKFIPNSKN
jgi:O-antigen/teichoic acid export membrane protein